MKGSSRGHQFKPVPHFLLYNFGFDFHALSLSSDYEFILAFPKLQFIEVEPRGFADSMGGREETRMMPRSFGLSPSRSGVAI